MLSFIFGHYDNVHFGKRKKKSHAEVAQCLKDCRFGYTSVFHTNRSNQINTHIHKDLRSPTLIFLHFQRQPHLHICIHQTLCEIARQVHLHRVTKQLRYISSLRQCDRLLSRKQQGDQKGGKQHRNEMARIYVVQLAHEHEGTIVDHDTNR